MHRIESHNRLHLAPLSHLGQYLHMRHLLSPSKEDLSLPRLKEPQGETRLLPMTVSGPGTIHTPLSTCKLSRPPQASAPL